MCTHVKYIDSDNWNESPKEGQPGEYHDDNSSVISISPISNHYAKSLKGKGFDRRSLLEWKEIFAHAAFFRGYDASLFSHVFIMVFKNEGRLSTVSLTGRGLTIYEKLLLDERSRFWPSCENLETKFKGSKVRRALAITNLKNYTILASESRDLRSPWDETNAGSLASYMQLITEKSPLELGVKMLELGMLQSHYIESIVVDVIARQEWNKAEKQEEDSTSSVILGLGNQLDHLFDPLLDYSPEIVDFRYRVPIRFEEKVQRIPKIEEICQELIQVQANYTSRLLELLQDLVIPLRNHCTADSEKSILVVNKVFPPTIDEIVRINTILQESLKKAVSFGFLEILKVFSLLLPYFYRPFVRHEANIKGISIRLHEFFDKNEELFEDSKLNTKQFTLRKIDSIVSGSLLELPQFKLILVRILEEVQNAEGAESHELRVLSDAKEYLNSSIGVIDAFGYEKECTLENSTTRKRVFTATGKILEELATNWPFSLQYGWLTRKVVGIFELKNMLATSYDLEIMIIFSDAVVFLQVMNESYLNIRNRFDGLSLSDILMNSLVNEKPLPKLSNLPTLKVRHWFNVNDITISSYKGIDADANNEYSYLHVLSSGSFNEDVKGGITLNYRILDDKQKSRGSRIIELVNKSKILNRRQPFHLLKTADSGLTMYSLIQDEQTYKEEKSKASVALFINHEKPSDLVDFFDLSKNIYLILNASFKSPSKVRLVGFNRDYSFEVDEVLNKDMLREAVKAVTIRAYGHLNGKLAFQKDATFNLYASYSKFLCSDFREYGTSPTLLENLANKNASKRNNLNKSDEDGSPRLSTAPIKNDELKAIDSPRIRPKLAVGDLGHNTNKKSKNIIRRLFSMIRPKTRVKHKAPHNGSVPTKQSQSQILKDVTNGRKKPGLDQKNATRAPLPGKKVLESSLVLLETKVDESIQFDQDKNLLISKTDVFSGKAPGNLSTKMKQSDNKRLDYRNPVEMTEIDNTISQQKNCVYPEKQRRQLLVSTIILVNDENLENTAISSRSSIFSPNSSQTLNCLLSNSLKDAFNCSFEYKVEDFYEDGQKNWIQVTRDNSSLLNAEIRALKEETNMDTEEVIFLNETNSASNTKAFNSLGSDNFHTALFSNTRDTNLHEKSTGAETSYQSETPSEIAREFSNFVSMNFESLDLPEQFDEKQGKQPKAKSPEVAAIGSPSSGTSDEEYFSTDDVDLSNSVFKSLYDVQVTV